MTAGKRPEPTANKQWRLEQIRDQMKEFEQWFHPAPDEVANLMYLARQLGTLGNLSLSKEELSKAVGDSVIPMLIKFSKTELGKIVKYCDNRKLLGKGTLNDSDIQAIKALCQATDIVEVDKLCSQLKYVTIADALARIMRICCFASNDPCALNDLSISELRGDLLEIVAQTYADVNIVLREQAEQGIDRGFAQVKGVIGATKARKDAFNEKGVDISEMKIRAAGLKNAHPDWTCSAIAKKLHEEFPKVPYHTIRKYDWLKKLTAP